MANGRGFGMDEGETQDREILVLLDEMKGRLGPTEPELLTPPLSVWLGIEQAFSGAGSAPVSTASPEADDTTSAAQSSRINTSSVVAGSTGTGAATTSLDHHRKRRRPVGMLLGSIAAAVLFAVAIGQVRGSSITTVGETEMADLGTEELVGTATLLATDDGQELRVKLDVALAGTQPGEFFELWIIDPAVEEMYSLGHITGDSTFDLPPGVDAADFPIVDISLEADDGDLTHSGDSIYRGHL